MGLKIWISNNLDSDSSWVWVTANCMKFLIEVAISGIVGVILFLCIYGVIQVVEGSFPFGAAGPTTLYFILACGAYTQFWNCRLSPDSE